MVNILWAIGAVTAGFLFSKMIYGFVDFMMQTYNKDQRDHERDDYR